MLAVARQIARAVIEDDRVCVYYYNELLEIPPVSTRRMAGRSPTVTRAFCGPVRRLLPALLVLAAVAGCASQSALTAPAHTSSAHHTSPAATQPTGSGLPTGWHGSLGLPWKCVTGYINFFGTNGVQVGSDNAGAALSAPFHPGPPPPNDSRVPGAAYTLTVSNRATANAVITGFVVVLYNQGGAEIGQSTATFPGQFITPGQQWKWLESSDTSLNAQWSNDLPGGVTAAFPEAATCRVVNWNPS